MHCVYINELMMAIDHDFYSVSILTCVSTVDMMDDHQDLAPAPVTLAMFSAGTGQMSHLLDFLRKLFKQKQFIKPYLLYL